MFCKRYFAGRYFPQRYFPEAKVAGAPPAPTDSGHDRRRREVGSALSSLLFFILGALNV